MVNTNTFIREMAVKQTMCNTDRQRQTKSNTTLTYANIWQYIYAWQVALAVPANRDIAAQETAVNGRTVNARTTAGKHDASAVYCWRRH